MDKVNGKLPGQSMTHVEKLEKVIAALHDVNEALRDIQEQGPWPLQWMTVTIGWATTSWEGELARVLEETREKMKQLVVPGGIII